MPIGKEWHRAELIVAFNLYCKVPFGQLHKSNPLIIQLANKLGRTPSSVAMKLVNFASLDPTHKNRGIKGLYHTSTSDRQIWEEFNGNWESLAFESQKAFNKLFAKPLYDEILDKAKRLIDKPTEKKGTVRIRLVQSFFREAVLSSYNFACSMCRLNIVKLLNASHIIPWSVEKKRRGDPRNGLSLCALHDRAFDRGLISIDDKYRILLSKELKAEYRNDLYKVAFLNLEGSKIMLPEKFKPDLDALVYHREKIFSE
jgi:putative restriction endonuclease